MSLNELQQWARSRFDSVEIAVDGFSVGGIYVQYFDLNGPETVKRLSTRRKPDHDAQIAIYSSEWVRRPIQWKQLIESRTGAYELRIGARECELIEVDKFKGRKFLDENHIQGCNNLSLVYFGLTYAGELVGLVSLGRHHRETHVTSKVAVLDRMCFKAGVQVVGGGSRLFKRCREWAVAEGYDEIVSFSDNRWADGGLYTSLGFSLDVEYRSDYFYVKDGIVYSKQSQRKSSSKCPEGMTEWEWAVHRGLTRIYDFGKKRWIFNLKPGEHITGKERISEDVAKKHRDGFFNHFHFRGQFWSNKNSSSIYYGSSYELRCLYMLENDATVRSFDRCDAFKTNDGWRNPDISVTYADGHHEIIEVKPMSRLDEDSVIAQIQDSIKFAKSLGASFRVWTEADCGLPSSKIKDWAINYAAESLNDDRREYYKKQSREKSRRYYERNIASDKVEVDCKYCHEKHYILRISYDSNISRNGRYICEREGGYIAGSRPKDHLKKVNPYADEGKKQCSKCKQVRFINEFDVRTASWDGRSAQCKLCVSAKNTAKYQERQAALGKGVKRQVEHGSHVDIVCEYCHETHYRIRYRSWKDNIARNNRYICQKEGQAVGRSNRKQSRVQV